MSVGIECKKCDHIFMPEPKDFANPDVEIVSYWQYCPMCFTVDTILFTREEFEERETDDGQTKQ